MTKEQKNNTENQNKKGTKDSIYKKWWFWVIAVFAFFIIIGAVSEESETDPVAQKEAEEIKSEEEKAETKNDEMKSESDSKPDSEPKEESESESKLESEPEPEPISDEGKTDKVTLGEKNALRNALDYLDYAPFSYSGLVEQLEFEGYTHKEAVYGVDNCGADWNEQAALMAKSYLDYSSFSRDGLLEQLEFEGFTRQQAEYGVQSVGY